MRGIPEELFIALIFAAILLVQFLYKQLRGKAESLQLEPEPEAAAAPVPSTVVRTHAAPAEAGAHGTTTDMAEARRALLAARAVSQAGPSRTPPPAWRRPRRFSRTALMPDRRAVQDAIVIAAILQPCHAHRPHEVD